MSDTEENHALIPTTERYGQHRSPRKAKYVVLTVLSGLCALGFSFGLYNSINDSNMAAIENNLRSANAVLAINESMESNVDKVIRIVDQHNPELSPRTQRIIAREIYEMTVKYDNLNTDLICATITHESARTWDSTVVSEAGAMGLMQIMPATGAYLAEREGITWTTAEEVLFNPVTNIRLGCRYLSMLIDSYDIDGGLAAYNGGLKRAEMWLASNRNDLVLWEETRSYVPAVLQLYDEFKNDDNGL